MAGLALDGTGLSALSDEFFVAGLAKRHYRLPFQGAVLLHSENRPSLAREDMMAVLTIGIQSTLVPLVGKRNLALAAPQEHYIGGTAVSENKTGCYQNNAEPTHDHHVAHHEHFKKAST